MKNYIFIFSIFLNIYSEPVVVKDAYDNTVAVVSAEDFDKYKKAVQEYVALNKTEIDELVILDERVNELRDLVLRLGKQVIELHQLLKKDN